MALQATMGGAAAANPPRWLTWTGRVLTAVPVAMLLLSAGMKLARTSAVVEGFVGRFGYPEGAILPIGAVELACALLYALPRTSVLGAILMTAYLGGAVATHVRVSDAFAPPIVLAVLAWGGLFLRDARLRALLPLRRPE